MTEANHHPDVPRGEPRPTDAPRTATEQAAVAQAAGAFCETLREVYRQGYTLPREIADLAALQMLREYASADQPADAGTVAQLAWVFCWNARRAIQAGLEGHEHLGDLSDVELLDALTRKIRAEAGLSED